MKKRIRLIIDICMAVIAGMMMTYSLIGEEFHEVAGTVIFALFIAHHVLNRGWYKALAKGRWTPERVFQVAIDIVLLFAMLAQPVSGILMSKHLYTFIQLDGATASARELHLCLAYWLFVLISVHMGMHLAPVMRRLWRRSRPGGIAVAAAWAAVGGYGVAAFIQRQFSLYMFRQQMFVFIDYSEPVWHALVQCYAVMALFAGVGCAVALALRALTPQKTGARQSR